MTVPPEQRIREHLDRKGGATTVELGRMLGTFGLGSDADAAERARVAEALAAQGVLVVPAIETTPADVVVRLEVADPAALAARARRREVARFEDPPEVLASRARARAREDRAPDATPSPVREATRSARAASVPQEPVEIPAGLPRGLLTGGAAVVVGSLFLPWFTGRRGGIALSEPSSGWEWLSLLDVLLLAVAVAAGALLAVRTAGSAARAVAGLATAALGGVVFRMAAPPDEALPGFVLDLSLDLGPFVAVAGLLAVIAGAGLLASPAREGTITPDGQAGEAPAT